MATSINNLDQSIAWGVTPSWVSGQLNKTLKAGTGTGSYKDMWGKSHSYSYTIMGLSTINPDGFNLSQWNSYNASTQGSKSNDTYFNNGGGYSLNANTSVLTGTQNVGDITYGSPVQTVSTQPATDSSGQTVSQVADNTAGSAPLVQTLALNYMSTVSSNSSTTNGWSDTITVSIGGSVSATLEGIGATVNSSVTNATTINSSSTSGTTNSQTSSITSTSQITVQPGYKLQVVVNYNSQNITMPYTAPVTVTGSSSMTDKYGNTISYNVGDAVQSAVHYGVPNAQYAQGTNLTGNNKVAKLLATGNIYNLNSTDFTITQYTLVSPATTSTASASAVTRMAAPMALENSGRIVFGIIHDAALNQFSERSDGATILVDEPGKPQASVKTGLMYEAASNKMAGSISIGSSTDDWIELNAPNQIAHTFGGNDIVRGSRFGDKVYSNGNNLGGDNISTGDGADLVVSNNSGDKIDAGRGHDRIFVSLDGSGVDDITLGSGKDFLQLSFDPGLKKIAAIVRDLTLEDDLHIRGNHTSLTAVRSGSSVELVQSGKTVAVLQDYATNFDSITGNQLIEVGLNNMDMINADLPAGKTTHSDLTEWREALLKQSALGNNFNSSFQSLQANKGEFDLVVKNLSQYLFDQEVPSLASWAGANASKYDNALDFSSGLIAAAESSGLTPVLPGFII
jgi:hypothetical protein